MTTTIPIYMDEINACNYLHDAYRNRYSETQIIRNTETEISIIEPNTLFNRITYECYYDYDRDEIIKFYSKITDYNNICYEKTYDYIQYIFDIFDIPYTSQDIMSYYYLSYRFPSRGIFNEDNYY
jgi:hypothetical protein